MISLIINILLFKILNNMDKASQASQLCNDKVQIIYLKLTSWNIFQSNLPINKIDPHLKSLNNDQQN
jgi:hypothetical protein